MSKREKSKRPGASQALATGDGNNVETYPQCTPNFVDSQAPEETIDVRDSRTRGWFWIDNELIDELGPELGPYGLATYMALCKHADNKAQTCYPSYATLARETGMSRRQTMRAIRKLEDLGLITIEPRTTEVGDPTSNLFKLLAKSKWGGSDSQSPPSDRESPGVVTGSHQGSDSQSSPSDSQSPKQDSANKTQQEENKDNNNSNGIVAADLSSSSLSQLLTDIGIRDKKHQAILALNPPAEWVKRYREIAEEDSNVRDVAAWVIARLESGDPPPDKREKAEKRRPRPKNTLTLEQRYLLDDPSLTSDEIEQARRQRGH